MGIPVKLEAFEGPLDLLLHLIDKDKIDIYDIPIVQITNQYLEYVLSIDRKDLDLMSEFLVMAATLLEIKSKMLLPVDEEDPEEDPRTELVERLLEYKLYKYMAEELKGEYFDATKVLYKGSSIPHEIEDYKPDVDIDKLLSDVSLYKLSKIFNSIIKKQEDKIDPIRSKFGEIKQEDVDLPSKLIKIQEFGLKHRKFSFYDLINNDSTKMDVIVTFLGILELMKIGRVSVEQDELFDDISIIYLAEDIILMEGVGF